MASISSSGNSSGSDDTTRRLQQDYKANESESAKRHNLELKKLTETHAAEMEDLKKQHSRDMDELRSHSNEAISRQDMKYQKEINDLRDMHQRQVMKNAAEADAKSTRAQDVLKGDLAHNEKTSEKQRDHLITNFDEEIRTRDSAQEETLRKARESQNDALEKSRSELNENYDKKYKELTAQRDQKVEQLQNDYANYREFSDKRDKGSARDHQNQIGRLNQNFETSIMEERKDHVADLDNARAGFNSGLKDNRDRYGKALKANQESLETAREDIADTVNGRVGSEINSLRQAKTQLERDRTREHLAYDRQKNMEMKNLRDSYQGNLDVSEKNRKELVDDVNKRVGKNIDRVNASNEDLVNKTNRFYQEKISMDSMRADDRLNTVKKDADTQKNHSENASAARFEKLKASNDIAQERSQNYFNNSAKVMQDNYDTQLGEIRLHNKGETGKIFENFSKQSSENDRKYQEKLNGVSTGFERQIAELEDKHQNEMKSLKAESDRRLKEQVKKDKTDMASQSSQTEYKIAKMEESHQREMHEVQRRHQEALANLTKTKQG